MTEATVKPNQIDSAAVISAAIVVACLVLIALLIEDVLSLSEGAKHIFYALALAGAAPVYQQLCLYFRIQSPPHAVEEGHYKYIFSSAFTIAIVAFALLEGLSYLAGAAAVQIYQELLPGVNTPDSFQKIIGATGFISFFMILPTISLFCITSGWLISKTRTNKAWRFAAYFFVAVLIFSMVDAYLAPIAQVTSLFSVLFKPALLTVMLLIGFGLKYAWTAVVRS